MLPKYNRLWAVDVKTHNSQDLIQSLVEVGTILFAMLELLFGVVARTVYLCDEFWNAIFGVLVDKGLCMEVLMHRVATLFSYARVFFYFILFFIYFFRAPAYVREASVATLLIDPSRRWTKCIGFLVAGVSGSTTLRE